MSYRNKLVGLLLVGITPFLILICFCHPSGDDFSYAVLGTKQDLLPALLDEYKLWNGRFTSNIFALKNPLIYPNSWIWLYRISIFVILSFGFITAYFFFLYFLKQTVSKGWIFFISLLFLLLNLFQMPILSEGTYWYTGVVTYQLANSFTLLYLIALQFFSIRQNGIYKLLAFIGLCVSIIVISGFNEVIMLFMLVFHALILFIQFQRKTENKNWFLGLFLASIVSFCLVYFAPGNKVREAYFIGESHRFVHSLFYTFLQIFRFGFDWLSSGVLILLSLVYLPFHKLLIQKSDLVRNQFYINKWISLIALATVLFLAIFPAYWSTGIMGQHRTVNTAYFYFILLWFINLSIWSNTQFIQKIIVSEALRKYALVFTIIIITFTDNSFTAWKDIFTSDAFNYDKFLKKRYEQLDAIQKNTYQLQQIPALIDKPASIFIYDITKDPHYFPNTSYKSYWKIKAFIVAK